MLVVHNCPRCIKGQIARDWDGPLCLQCGYRPPEANPMEKFKGRREPKLPKTK